MTATLPRPHDAAPPAHRSGPRAPAVALAATVAAGGACAVAIWLAGHPARVHDVPSGLLCAGRLAGLLGAYLALVQVALLARLPALERAMALDRRVAWHRPVAVGCLGLLCLHAVLVTAGDAAGDGLGPVSELGRLITSYPGVITAIAALAILIAVAVSSARWLRARMRYETWHFVHLYTYLAVALAFSHQIATGSDFVGNPVARTYWTALYVVVAANVAVGRIGVPLMRARRHRLRVARVIPEGETATTIEIAGRRLDRLTARSGQFFTWRFLTRDRWWESHPFSLSAAPDGQRLRITVKALGDFSSRLRTIAPGTRVIVDGPFGALTADRRRRARVALIAGGVGITPIRALLEDMPAAPGEIAVLYRASAPEELVLRDELEAIAAHRGAEVHLMVGDGAVLSADAVRALVPDIAERDVYVCGPPEMARQTRRALVDAGVPPRHIATEGFAL